MESTNSQYFVEENIQCVIRSSLDYINFSMHAVTPERYRIVTKHVDFNTVEGNLDLFFENKGSGNFLRKLVMYVHMIEQETTLCEIDTLIQKYCKRAEIVSINMLEYVGMPNNEYGMKQRDCKALHQVFALTAMTTVSVQMAVLCYVAYKEEILLSDINYRHSVRSGAA